MIVSLFGVGIILYSVLLSKKYVELKIAILGPLLLVLVPDVHEHVGLQTRSLPLACGVTSIGNGYVTSSGKQGCTA